MHRLALSVLSLTLVASLACKSESAAPTPVAASETGSSEPAPTPAGAEVDGAPKIACAEAVYNFGAVSPTDKIEHVFTIKNEGTAELRIERVQKT